MKRLIALALALAIGSPVLAQEVNEPLLKNKIAAWKVIASQVAIGDRAIITASQRIDQARMAALGSLQQSLSQLEIFRSYGAFTGQGAQVCAAALNRNDINRIGDRMAVLDFVSMPQRGRLNVKPDNYTVAMVNEQLEKYCSADMHNLGICQTRFDGGVAVSMSYARINAAEQLTTQQLEGTKAFIANMVPPGQVVNTRSSGQCNAECIQSRVRGMRADAISSLVAVPMAEHFASRVGASTYAKTQTEAKAK